MYIYIYIYICAYIYVSFSPYDRDLLASIDTLTGDVVFPR